MQPNPIAETSRVPRVRLSMLTPSWQRTSRCPVRWSSIWLAGGEPGVLQPGGDLAALLGDFFAADSETLADPGARTRGGVVTLHAAEAGDGVGDDGQQGLAGEVVGVGEGRH